MYKKFRLFGDMCRLCDSRWSRRRHLPRLRLQLQPRQWYRPEQNRPKKYPLFKDEVRELGRKLGLPEQLVRRQPFPGPGLGVRIVGEITAQKVRLVQEADAIFREELQRFGVDTGSGQFFAALSNLRSVGVMGDGRTYDYAVVLRAVQTDDFMTATAARLPYELLDACMNRIINEVPGVNRVLYDLTSKPPATIELE